MARRARDADLARRSPYRPLGRRPDRLARLPRLGLRRIARQRARAPAAHRPRDLGAWQACSRTETQPGSPSVLSGLVRCDPVATSWAPLGPTKDGRVRAYRCNPRKASGRCPRPAFALEHVLLELVEPIFWRLVGGDLVARPTEGDDCAERVRDLERERDRRVFARDQYRDDPTFRAPCPPRAYAEGLEVRQRRVDEIDRTIGVEIARRPPVAADATTLRLQWPQLEIETRRRMLHAADRRRRRQRAGKAARSQRPATAPSASVAAQRPARRPAATWPTPEPSSPSPRSRCSVFLGTARRARRRRRRRRPPAHRARARRTRLKAPRRRSPPGVARRVCGSLHACAARLAMGWEDARQVVQAAVHLPQPHPFAGVPIPPLEVEIAASTKISRGRRDRAIGTLGEEQRRCQPPAPCRRMQRCFARAGGTPGTSVSRSSAASCERRRRRRSGRPGAASSPSALTGAGPLSPTQSLATLDAWTLCRRAYRKRSAQRCCASWRARRP